MIYRADDSIWAMASRRGPSGRGSDSVSALPYEQEQARRRRAWELRRQNNELLEKKWAELPPQPTKQDDIGPFLDLEYAKHQRRNRGWTGHIFDPDPVDNSLPRDEWDDRVRAFVRNPVRPPGAEIARDPHALAGHDAVLGVRDTLVNTRGSGKITNRGVAEEIRDHYGMGTRA